MAAYNYTVNAGRSIRHYVGKSTAPLPQGAPEGSDLYQYDTNAVLFYDSEAGAWFDRLNEAFYRPGTAMERV